MINVEIKPNSIKITGHAGAGPYGHDIVCSAVSMLVFTFIDSVGQLSTTKLDYRLRPGYAYIQYDENTADEPFRTLLASLKIGLELLNNSYSQNLTYYKNEESNQN